MTASYADALGIEQESLYQEGLAHYQAGEWQEAIHCFEELAQMYPGETRLQDLLEQARFKAHVDADSRVTGKRIMIPWKRVILALVTAATLLLAVVLGVQALRHQVAPAIAQARAEQAQAQLLSDANSLLEGGKLDEAEQKLNALLAQAPDHPEAQQGLERLRLQRELSALYEQGVALQQAGDLAGALAIFQDLLVRTPEYQDVRLRMGEIQHTLKVQGLFANAQAAYETGDYARALDLFEQLQALDASYQASTVQDRLYELYMSMGRELLESQPPMAELVPKALEYFGRALTLRPNSPQAAQEKQLGEAFLQGLQGFQQGYYDPAVTNLRAVYDRRPDYLGGMVLRLLYEACVRSGDQYRRDNDLGFAYQQYRQAEELPVDDNTLARERLKDIVPLLTPTPTPTATPTPTNTPMPTTTPQPTVAPTPRPLASYRNHVAFWSDDEDQPGLWVMDPTFKNRTYLGDSRALRREFDELVTKQSISPDGRYVLFVANSGGSAQIFMQRPRDPRRGDLPPLQLTRLNVCYHPVWSPDGSRIAFVSEQDRTDDIWIMNADGSGQKNLTENTWEWEKHPTWSPDGTKIVFWSNREGHQQLYIMDADGRNVRNISNTPHGEYDPLWIK
ncbi:MAG: tetratricopeptide repeat protein [Chloroflexi bacterium]|nr:tetratricopeptide repeat protein [Chloroflexota bacterium]